MSRSLVLTVLAFLCAMPFAAASPSSDPQPRQSAEQLTFPVTFSFHYLLYLPEGYEQQRQTKWPLVVFLHGIGERGTDVAAVKRQGLPRLLAAGKQFPFLVVSPQCPPDQWWDITALDEFVERVTKKYRVDPDRVYLTGLSMGGFGTWALAMRHPQRFAAIAPICGGGEARHAYVLRDVPVWAFHGAKDEVVPLRQSEEMIAALRDAGAEPRFTIYPEGKHDVWTETYADPELYTWLLAQTRTHRPPAKK